MANLSSWSLADAWQAIPIITRNLVAGMAFVTIGSQLRLFPVQSVLLIWDKALLGFQFWRFLTSFLFLGPLGFPLIMLAAILYRQSKSLEIGEFLGNPADYLFFLLFVGVTSLPLAYFFKLVYMGPTLVFAMLQLWARKSRTQMVSIMGMINMPALYYPYALLAVNFVLSGGMMDWMGIVGILTGHLYYFLTSVYPRLPGRQGRVIIKTPQILYNMFRPAEPSSSTASGAAPTRVGPGGTVGPAGTSNPSSGFGLNLGAGQIRQRVTGGHPWGGGQRLGGADN